MACKDDAGQLRVGAGVGAAQDTDERVDALVEAGADVIVVDTRPRPCAEGAGPGQPH